jgi:hypothetical protein
MMIGAGRSFGITECVYYALFFSGKNKETDQHNSIRLDDDEGRPFNYVDKKITAKVG